MKSKNIIDWLKHQILISENILQVYKDRLKALEEEIPINMDENKDIRQ